MDSLRNLDDRLFFDVNSLARHTGWLHGPMLAYAQYGVVVFGLLLFAGLLVTRHAPSPHLAGAGWASLAVLVAVAVNQPITHIVNEARPYTTHPHALLLASRSSDLSFPSDHAVMAGAVAAGLLLVSRRLGLVATAAALLMAFVRVYVGAHYPWDVIAGLAVGVGVAILGWLLLGTPLTALTRWLRNRRGLRTLFLETVPQPPGPMATTPATSTM
jgi:membrane-associated phospholipid phosphatase